MSALDEPTQAANDPEVSIFLDVGESEPELIAHIRKSRLIEQSGFFRAMFQHDFAENASNEVILHDDDVDSITWLMVSISSGSIQYERTHWHKEIKRNVMLGLLHKYDCSHLQAGLLELFLRDARDGAKIWNTDEFLEHHYDIVNDALGNYPEELFEAFAIAWKTLEYSCEPTDKLTAIVEANPALSAFLATFYCKAIVNVQRAAEDAIRVSDKAEWAAYRASELASQAEGAVHGVQKALSMQD